MDPATMRDIVLNVNHPVKIKGYRHWDFMKERSLSSWLENAHNHNKDPSFEVAPQKHGNSPQFERFRKIDKTIDFGSFLDYSGSKDQINLWTSYSYKSLRDLKGSQEMNMSFCGFPEISDEITIWLGSAGAHTSCHYDSYGRNVVVQAYGRKRWILFSPDTPDMSPTRIPYEESSVYSERTFFSPKDPNQNRDISEYAYVVDLEPGDVLIIPPKWWHYVEALENSLSFNAWIPIEQDNISRIDEFLVMYQLSKIIPSDISDEEKRLIFNPNSLDDYQVPSTLLLEVLIKDAKEGTDASPPKQSRRTYKTNYLPKDQLEALIIQHSMAKVPINPTQFMKIMSQNSSRFCPKSEADLSSTDATSHLNILLTLINSLCAPSTIATARNILLNSPPIQ